MNFEAEIVEVKRMPNTSNGNPRFSVLMNPSVGTITRLTAKDHMFVFGIVPSDLEGKLCTITEDDDEFITNIEVTKYK